MQPRHFFSFVSIPLLTLSVALTIQPPSEVHADGNRVCRRVVERYRCDRPDRAEQTNIAAISEDTRPGNGRGRGRGRGGGGGRGRDHENWCRREVVRCRTACAPEVEEGNLQATQRVLSQLSSSQGFQNTELFQATVDRISRIENAKEKFAAYLSLIGLEDASDEEIYEFIGSRQVDQKYIGTLQERMALTPHQAETVVNTLMTELRGNLN